MVFRLAERGSGCRKFTRLKAAYRIREAWAPTIVAQNMESEPEPQLPKSFLPVQLHRELELSHVVGRGRLARVGKQWAHCSHVHFVGKVEHVHDQIHTESLAEVDAF